MNRRTQLLLTGMAAVIWAAPLRADAPRILQRVESATLTTTATVDETGGLTLALTDVMTLMIEVTGGSDLEVQAPERWTQGSWMIRRAGPEQRRTGRWSQSLHVEPTMPGRSSLTLEPLKMRDNQGDWRTVMWTPVEIRVTSRLTNPELKQARDITAIEELPTAPTPETLGLHVIAVITGALFAIVFMALIWRRRQVRVSGGVPAERALATLERLQARRLPEQGKHERFGTLLAGLVSRYLERKHQLPARRRTTDELLKAIAQHPTLGARHGFFESFLRRCDFLKFAPIESTISECRELAALVREFLIEEHKSHLRTGA